MQIIYEILTGEPNFTASILPAADTSQTLTAIGVYSFDNLPDNNYTLTVIDSEGCTSVNYITTTTTSTSSSSTTTTTTINPCILEGTIDCNISTTSTTTIPPSTTTTSTTIPISSTTTTTTTIGICTNCPEGYTPVIGACYIEDIVASTGPTDPQYLVAKNNIRYGTIGTIVFDNTWIYDGTGSTFNLYNSGSFWINPIVSYPNGTTTDGVMNKNAVWSAVTLDNQTVGFPICFEVASEKVYLIGLGSDNYAEIKVDGVSILMQDPTALGAMFAAQGWTIPNPLESTFRAWFIYPVTLSAGKHIIELIGHNTVSVAGVGLDIYDMTESALLACTSYSDMGAGLIFSTKDEVGQLVKIGNEGQGYTCPVDYVLGYCDVDPKCYKIEYISCPDVPPTTTTSTTTVPTTTTTTTASASTTTTTSTII